MIKLSILKQIFFNTKLFFASQNCLVCRQKSKGLLCEYCSYCLSNDFELIEEIKYFNDKECHYYAVTKYNETFRYLLAKFKFNNDIRIACIFTNMLNEWLFKYKNNFLQDVDLVLPIPIHKRRYFYRGFNQCEVILKKSNLFNLANFDVVCRSKYTKPQSKSSKSLRSKQLINVFRQKSIIKSKHLIIFDDVYTTGSTIKSIVNELTSNKQNEINKISIITLAKVFSKSL